MLTEKKELQQLHKSTFSLNDSVVFFLQQNLTFKKDMLCKYSRKCIKHSGIKIVGRIKRTNIKEIRYKNIKKAEIK